MIILRPIVNPLRCLYNNHVMLCHSVFSVEPTFEFTQQVFSSPEATNIAVAGIWLAAGSAELGSPVSVSVTTLGSGTAKGRACMH